MSGKFSVSWDGERYHGDYGSIEEAMSEGTNSGRAFWIGECEPPTQPEDLWDADEWLEYVSCQDEYCNEWAEDWDQSTKEHRAELEAMVRPVLAAWLDKHDLRPKFYNIVNAKKFDAEGNPK